MARPAARLLLALLAAASPARASGTLTCNARDANLAFEAQAVVSRGMGSGWSGFSAKLEVRARGFPAPLARRAFARGDLVHSWSLEPDIRMVLYAEEMEGGAHRWIEMVVRDGRYRLTALASDAPGGSGRPKVLRGRIACSADTTG